jgi:cephalosporin hydroxylase
MRPEAARTRPRCRTVPNLFGPPATPRIPDKATPMPHDLRAEFVSAYWNTLAWRKTSWLGQRVPRPPTDLFAYQELMSRVRPDWIIETGTGNGGRAHFLATICDLLNHGQVLSIAEKKIGDRPQHPRIIYVEGDPTDGATLKQVGDIVGALPEGSSTSALAGPPASRSPNFGFISSSFRSIPTSWSRNTVVNGHPLWPDFGPGPAEAVKGVVESRADFVADLSMSKYGLSFNPGGFLKRVRLTSAGQ